MAKNARRLYAQIKSTSSALFGILGDFFNYISTHFKEAVSNLRSYPFSFNLNQFISSSNQSLALIIALLTALLQLKHQGDVPDKTPFVTHPRTMYVAICSSVAFYLASIALLRIPLRGRSAIAAEVCLGWRGYASVASLASLLFPNSVSRFVYAIFVLISAAELLYYLCHGLEEEEDADPQ